MTFEFGKRESAHRASDQSGLRESEQSFVIARQIEVGAGLAPHSP